MATQFLYLLKSAVSFLAVALAVLTCAVSQQQTSDSSAIGAVNAATVVTLPVTVLDKHSQVVRDLTKDDFVLQEDGRPETIKSFSLESNLPLTLGVLVDTSWSQRESLDQERNASRGFFEHMLTPKDKAFLIHFDREVELMQDLTSHQDKLASALDALKTAEHERSSDSNSGDSRSGSGGESRGGRTQLYDAVYLASNELLKKLTGRKAVVILSDGVDRGSKTGLEGAIESAQRADTVVYTVYFAGRREDRDEREEGRGGRPGGGGVGVPGGGWPGGGGGWPGGGGGGRRGGQRREEEPHVDGKKILQRIANETGGRFFEATKKESLGDIYSSIAEELRAQYSLSYTPDKDSSATGYHKVQLQVKRKDLTVQTRAGYYAGKED
jgi:VWFA-related protein